jgi:hypothetical protein
MTTALSSELPRFRTVELPQGIPGRLLLHSMPGRFEAWEQFLRDAGEARLGTAVCLVPMDEVHAVSPSYGQAVESGTLPFRWHHLPMHNFSVAAHADHFLQGVHLVADALRGGEVVLLHCAAGIGRTGTAAACVLKALGSEAAHALLAVHRAGSDPQSAIQSGMIERF